MKASAVRKLLLFSTDEMVRVGRVRNVSKPGYPQHRFQTALGCYPPVAFVFIKGLFDEVHSWIVRVLEEHVVFVGIVVSRTKVADRSAHQTLKEECVLAHGGDFLEGIQRSSSLRRRATYWPTEENTLSHVADLLPTPCSIEVQLFGSSRHSSCQLPI